MDGRAIQLALLFAIYHFQISQATALISLSFILTATKLKLLGLLSIRQLPTDKSLELIRMIAELFCWLGVELEN
jgi:hypothetical protein